ncbi:MAG TPA: TlpA disulfide reductase family protein [Pyrinomonadaceae bacterium]|jgi:thiol-disulfide isomerase/thioredoxin
MTSSTPRCPRPAIAFWTTRRLSVTFIALAFTAIIGVSGCTQSGNVETPNSNSAIVTTNAPAGNASNKAMPNGGGNNSTVPTNPNAPTNNSAPANSGLPNTAMLTPLPVALLNAPLKTIDGKPFKLSDAKGKVLVLDLWATWCGPCRQEIPHLVELYKEMGPQGVEVIGLDIDPESDTPADVQAFMKEFNVNYKVAFLERQYAVTLMSDNSSIPQSYVITRDGKIHSRFIGFSTTSTAPRLRAAIEEALNTKG